MVVAAVAVCAAGSSAVAAPRAGTARSLPKLAVGFPPRYAVRPHSIDYTGDGSGVIGVLPHGAPAVGKTPGFLHWNKWNHSQANAVGTLWAKSCLPSCAASPFYRYSVTVTATRPRGGRFSTMTLRYTYHGKRVTDVRCDTGHGYWTLPEGPPGSKDCLAPQQQQ